MPRKYLSPFIIIILAILSILLASSDSGWSLRPYLLFGFIFICPGLAVIGLLGLNDFLSELVLSIALSLVLGTLVAELLVVTKHWSPGATLAILAAISLSGAGIQIRNTLRSEAYARQLK